MRDVMIVCGPTAAGKSAIAMALAERTGATLISADSRQVYRRFDIGTAKPSAADRAAVVHRGVDVAEPTARYSAAEWTTGVATWLAEADRAEKPTIIVGGTGFYLRALEEPLFDAPELDPAERQRVEAEHATVPTEVLRERCARLDPARAHLGRTQLLRALEVVELTGRPLSDWMRERARPAETRGHYLLVDPGPVLRERISMRVADMLAAGWESEVASLLQDVPPDAPAWNACGYAELLDVHRGVLSREAAIERIVVSTRQYAKRQRTWFRHQLPFERVTLLDPTLRDAHARAHNWLESVTPTEHL